MSEPAPSFIERHLGSRIREALLDTPVALVHGPRQCGKTTLVRPFADPARPYFSLDEPNLLQAVKADPVGFVRQHPCAIIDDVQRAPELLLALTTTLDTDCRPGRFLLTGSADVMALPHIADSLAGRMAVLTLLPLSHAELAGKEADFLRRAQAQHWPTATLDMSHPGSDLQQQVLAGGYPGLRQRSTPARRQAWAQAYLTTRIERDVQDVARIEDSTRLPQLLVLAAGFCGQMPNMSQLGGQMGLTAKTVDKYLGVFETMFLLRRLPAWRRHELNRLVKTPKLHFLDAGLQAALTRLTPALLSGVAHQRQRWAATLETWVYGELLKHLSADPQAWHLSYYRDKDQVEVDFVLESPRREVIGIEVKAAATVLEGDFKSLKRLRDQCAQDFVTGIVLYDGDRVLPFGPRLWAVPLQLL